MFKKKNISVYSDLKSGFFCKLFIFLGLILLIFYILLKTGILIGFNENVTESLIAFSIIFFGLGILSFFLSCQFGKLAKIADEIENENFLDEKNDSD